MYNDYPTADYSSSVDQFRALKIILPIVLVVLVIIILISVMKVFKKANRNGVSALIPFYNLIILLEICNLPKMYFAFLLIPFVNLIYFYKITQVLAELFKKDKSFGIGLFFLPVIYYPILGYGKSEYVGIDITASDSSKQVGEIKEIDELKNQEIEVEENVQEDKATRNINISLGGGKYQKDYAEKLDTVEDNEKVIAKRNVKKKTPAKPVVKTSTFIKPMEDIPKDEVKKTDTKDLFNVDFIETPKEEPKQEEKPQVDTFSEFFDCPNCGTKLKRGTKACFICGTKI